MHWLHQRFRCGGELYKVPRRDGAHGGVGKKADIQNLVDSAPYPGLSKSPFRMSEKIAFPGGQNPKSLLAGGENNGLQDWYRICCSDLPEP